MCLNATDSSNSTACVLVWSPIKQGVIAPAVPRSMFCSKRRTSNWSRCFLPSMAFAGSPRKKFQSRMTIGELARFFNEEKHLGADVRVVQIENWRRAMWFDSTGLTWINPSPNMRSLTEAALYPGIGLLETTNVSVGRGTDTPFEVVGAPWIDGPKLAVYLTSRRLPGVRFVPVRFKPNTSVFKNEECSGLNNVITDSDRIKSIVTGI